MAIELERWGETPISPMGVWANRKGTGPNAQVDHATRNHTTSMVQTIH